MNSRNVLAYAGGTPREDIQLSTQEVVSYSGGVLSYSRGSTSVVFSAASSTPKFVLPSRRTNKNIIASVPRYNGPRKKRQVSPNTFSSGTDLNEFKGSGIYSLTKVSCRAGKRKRSAIEDYGNGSEDKFVKDSLRAKINYSKPVTYPE